LVIVIDGCEHLREIARGTRLRPCQQGSVLHRETAARENLIYTKAKSEDGKAYQNDAAQ
jgi:hypothetical protein